jgi:hypothetical protein
MATLYLFELKASYDIGIFFFQVNPLLMILAAVVVFSTHKILRLPSLLELTLSPVLTAQASAIESYK